MEPGGSVWYPLFVYVQGLPGKRLSIYFFPAKRSLSLNMLIRNKDKEAMNALAVCIAKKIYSCLRVVGTNSGHKMHISVEFTTIKTLSLDFSLRVGIPSFMPFIIYLILLCTIT